MTAYAIFVREQTLNQTELDTYASKISSVFEKYGPEVLVAYGGHEVVEGDEIEGAVVVAFPDFETAKSWYHSPEYQDIVQHRLRGGRYRGIIVDGIPPKG